MVVENVKRPFLVVDDWKDLHQAGRLWTQNVTMFWSSIYRL